MLLHRFFNRQQEKAKVTKLLWLLQSAPDLMCSCPFEIEATNGTGRVQEGCHRRPLRLLSLPPGLLGRGEGSELCWHVFHVMCSMLPPSSPTRRGCSRHRSGCCQRLEVARRTVARLTVLFLLCFVFQPVIGDVREAPVSF